MDIIISNTEINTSTLIFYVNTVHNVNVNVNVDKETNIPNTNCDIEDIEFLNNLYVHNLNYNIYILKVDTIDKVNEPLSTIITKEMSNMIYIITM